MVEGFANASLRHWDLPQVALVEVWMGPHILLSLGIPGLDAIEYLLQDRYDVGIVVALAGKGVDQTG